MKILFFSPFQNTWVHSFPEAVLAKNIKNDGHEIFYVLCDGLFKYCIAMRSIGVDFDSSSQTRGKICRTCKRRASLNVSKTHANVLKIEDYISHGELSRISVEIDRFRHSKNKLLEHESDPLKRYASYSIILNYKLADPADIFKFHLNEYLSEYFNVLVTNQVAPKILIEVNPENVFMYNTYYPVNRTFQVCCEEIGISVFWIHTGPNLDRRLQFLDVGRGHVFSLLKRLLEKWDTSWRVKIASKHGISRVEKHYHTLLKGDSFLVYSSSSFDKLINLPSDKKIVLAIMSSLDELVAAKNIGVLSDDSNNVFSDQVDWLRKILKYFRNRKDVFLVIRLHPREFPNRNSKFLSDNAKKIMGEFKELPSNVVLNLPSDGVSIYQLFKATDLCLHYGSSSAKEAALLGIPIVTPKMDSIFYPKDISFFGDNEEGYFQAIEDALEQGWSFQTALNAFRWCALELHESIWSLEGICDLDETRAPSILERLIRKFSSIFGLLLSERKNWSKFDVLPEWDLFRCLLTDRNFKFKMDFYHGDSKLTSEEEKDLVYNKIFDIILQLYDASPESSNQGKYGKLIKNINNFLI